MGFCEQILEKINKLPDKIRENYKTGIIHSYLTLLTETEKIGLLRFFDRMLEEIESSNQKIKN